ncbi:MAG: hypothetical protein K2M78_10360 [Lachnospiraceae bacterium]|nr:hypothetical protein [Lachnospiraceae bacterium]
MKIGIFVTTIGSGDTILNRYYYKIRCRSAYGDTYYYGEYSNVESCVAE